MIAATIEAISTAPAATSLALPISLSKLGMNFVGKYFNGCVNSFQTQYQRNTQQYDNPFGSTYT